MLSNNSAGELSYLMPPVGRLHYFLLHVQRPDGYAYVVLTGVKWEGPPIALIPDRDIEALPHWAKIDDRTVQIGGYVLERTLVYDFAECGYYWRKVGEGQFYLWRWQLCQWLADMSRKVRITINRWKRAL